MDHSATLLGRLEEQYGRAMSAQELGKFLDLDYRTVKKYHELWGGVEVAPGKYRFFEKRIMEKLDAEQNPQEWESHLQSIRYGKREKKGAELPGCEQGLVSKSGSVGKGSKRGAVSRVPDTHGVFGSG